jgi:hypothetical protein
VKKSEYMGPDGDLVANLERDVLDRSPGIRYVGIMLLKGVGSTGPWALSSSPVVAEALT